MRSAEIVTSFLEFGGKILILKRSGEVSTYRGRWAGVSGSIEAGESPLEAAVREITEETGLEKSEFTLVREGGRFSIVDAALGVKWNINLFLFSVKMPRITIESEHTEFRWIRPGELSRYETVPKLGESLRKILGK